MSKEELGESIDLLYGLLKVESDSDGMSPCVQEAALKALWNLSERCDKNKAALKSLHPSNVLHQYMEQSVLSIQGGDLGLNHDRVKAAAKGILHNLKLLPGQSQDVGKTLLKRGVEKSEPGSDKERQEAPDGKTCAVT